MKKQDSSIFEQNYANTEYIARHKNPSDHPRQKPLEWSKWDELVDFFKGYFNHFGDDISKLDDDTLMRVIKTIWRMAYVCGCKEGMETQKLITPSFIDQLRDYFMEINRRNNEEPDDYYSPLELFSDVLKLGDGDLQRQKDNFYRS